MFQTADFALLFLLSFSAVWLLKEKRSLKNAALLGLSYLFFAKTNAAHPFGLLYPEIYTATRLVLITFTLFFASSSLDFFIGKRLGDTATPRIRKRLVLISITANLTLLGVFKYFDFFAGEISDLLDIKQSTGWRLVFPIGISFYTFQSLSYTIDVYRNRISPTRRYTTYLLYLAFFPQLVMGPIVRAEVLIPQLEARPVLDADKGAEAVARIGVGFIKKLAIAEFLRVQIVDSIFTNPEMYSSLEILTAGYGYAFQIWADFSGYTDIAIGTAGLLGITLPENFNAPYRAKNLREFWQRWHITLSTWLRDYLYIPLGGSRVSRLRTYLNLMITMLLGGLWHGAATTFIVWGGIHGIALVATHIAQDHGLFRQMRFPGRNLIAQVLTFHVVTFAWIFFRAPTFKVAAAFFKGLCALDPGVENISLGVVAVLIGASAVHFAPAGFSEKLLFGFKRLPAPFQAALLVMTIYLARMAASTDVSPFIYSQF
jgi:alginate O-acetyltransferase complex protein AlgI